MQKSMRKLWGIALADAVDKVKLDAGFNGARNEAGEYDEFYYVREDQFVAAWAREHGYTWGEIMAAKDAQGDALSWA